VGSRLASREGMNVSSDARWQAVSLCVVLLETRTAYSCARSRLWACCDRMFICTRLFQPDARPGAERTHRTNRSDHDWRPTTTTQDFCFKFYKGSVGSSTELARLAYDVGGQFLSRPPCLLVSLSKRRPKSFRHAGCSSVCVA
jgi:hypothetical protein